MSLAIEWIPPAVLKGLRPIKRRLFGARQHELFDGDRALFEREVRQCRVYGEYGVGASTNWVYANTSVPIVANETSPEWASHVLRDKDLARIDLQLIDVGALGAWGRPETYEKRENFESYCLSIWQRARRPDLVLIDGRFRVCCFMTAVLEGGAGLRILFDDYTFRPHYHVVEEILPVRESCGRQVFFEVTADIDREKAASLRDQFRMVMD